MNVSMLCEASNTDVDSCWNHSGVVHLLPQSEPVNTEIKVVLPYMAKPVELGRLQAEVAPSACVSIKIILVAVSISTAQIPPRNAVLLW